MSPTDDERAAIRRRIREQMAPYAALTVAEREQLVVDEDRFLRDWWAEQLRRFPPQAA